MIAFAALGLAIATPAAAQTEVVVPSGLDLRDGNWNSCVPFGIGCFNDSSFTARTQQIYDASLFGGQSGTIDRIRLRTDRLQGAFSASGVSLEIRLSHTTVAPGAMSSVFADNVTETQTVVLDSAAVSYSSGLWSLDFQVEIDLDNVFEYNGVDHLLLEVLARNTAANASFDVEAGLTTAKSVSVVGPGALTATGGGTPLTHGMAMTFVFAPAGPDDFDGDGIPDTVDNCITMVNVDQMDANGDGHGDVCIPPSTVSRGVVFGPASVVGLGSRIGRGTAVGSWADIGTGVTIRKDLTAGDNLTVGADSLITRGDSFGNDVTIGSNVEIRAMVVLGDRVVVEDNAFIDSNVVVGADSIIGTGSTISRNAVIGTAATLGANVDVGRNASVADGAVVPDGTVIPDGGSYQ